MSFSDLVQSQRDFLSKNIKDDLSLVAKLCAKKIAKKESMESSLKPFLDKHQFAQLAYITDHLGMQISANVSQDKVLDTVINQDLSNRPYFKSIDHNEECYLSETYISRASLKPCISAVHVIFKKNILIGLVVVDLDVEELPLNQHKKTKKKWQQLKGDPSIRENLFNQNRYPSLIDRSIVSVHKTAIKLLKKRGVFHLQIHYASSRISVRTYSDPYYDNIHTIEEIENPDLFLIYPKQPYPDEALVTLKQINQVFDQFEYLRFMDENLYLRTASINIIDGGISLNFSCDGSHYLTTEEFLSNLDKFR